MVYQIWYYIFHVGKWYFTCRKRKTCDRYWIVSETNMSSMSWIYFHMPWLLLGNGTSPMPTQQEKVWSSALLCLFFSDVCWEPSFSQRIVMTLPCFFLMGKGTTVYSHGVKWWTAEVSRYDFQHFLAVNELHMATAQNGESPKRTRQSYIHLTKHQTPAFLSVILCLLDAAC